MTRLVVWKVRDLQTSVAASAPRRRSVARARAASTAGVSMPRSSEVHDTAHRAPAQHAAPSMDAASSAYL
eukprot:scaffold44551_cov75-Phaeocystis_antarctica.AAC.2